jgi:copper resistance protein B
MTRAAGSARSPLHPAGTVALAFLTCTLVFVLAGRVSAAVVDDAPARVPAATAATAATTASAPAATSDAAMAHAMEMGDAEPLAMLRIDEFERARGDDATATRWNAQGWYGGDFDKLWLRSEGENETGQSTGRVEAFWDHAFSSFWDWQVGARRDFGGATRTWAAFGVQGLAPYWIEVEATAYVGEGGRSAARLRAEYELLLTQRLVLQPEVELNVYDRQDRARALAAGLADAEWGVRLRYEFVRKFAPYVGIVRSYRRPSAALPFTPNAGASDTRIVAGLRIWL